MALIHAVTLDTWANMNIARDTLGELLRKLILSNTDLADIKKVRILAHESNQLSGWDGILECQSKVPAWIPSGTSVWELGTGNNARQKIRDDFALRRSKELPSGWDRDKTTYVAVTLRKLDDISALENELKADSPWVDVRIIDAQSFEEWIGISQSVEIWLQEQGIGPPASVNTLPRYWRGWSEKTHPAVLPNLILAGRDKDASELLNNLASPGTPINIQADSPEEAIVFVYSVIDSSKDTLFRDHFLTRSLVIRKNDDAVRFLNDPMPKNIILCPPATSESLALVRSGHIVVNALGNKSLAQRIDIRLTRSLRSNFEEALVSMGIIKEQAGIEARACGSSPSIWRIWNLHKVGALGDDIPDWTKHEYADLIVPAVLLGGWSENFDGDKEIIKALTGKNFEEYRDQLSIFITRDNPLLVKVGDAWIISAPATAFALTIPFITQGHLENLSSIVNDVFKEIDPTLDLPPDERRYAGIRDVHLKHSAWLRDGLAESLLRIAVIGQRLEANGIMPGNQSCQAYVDTLARKLEGLQKDWRLWASLRDQLPVLAEAAPVPFVEALERLLQGRPEVLTPLFEEGDDVLFGHSFHAGLLWTLEMLAWSPDYLGRVVTILAQLAKIDSGGKTANRPINSLREILLAWHPGTSATIDRRIQALDLLLERIPDIGWKLLIKLMPASHETSFPTNEPIWRDFGRSEKEVLTNKIIRDNYISIIDRAIIHADMNPNRWIELINFYDDISDDHRKGIEEGLNKIAKSDLTEENRKKIWNTLRKFISKHREFPDASWSLQEDCIKRLEHIMEFFSPTNDIDRFALLFNEYWPDIPFPRDDHSKYDDEIKRLRRDAIGYLWQKNGIDSIKELLAQISFPGTVSDYVFEFFKNEIDVIRVIVDTNQGAIGEQVFARCLSAIAYNKYGESWTKILLEKAKELRWPPKALVNALLLYPDSQITFELITSLGKEIDQEYWKSRESWIRAEDNKEVLSFAIEKFISVGRSVDILTFASHYAKNLEPILLFRLLDETFNELNKGKVPVGDLGYHIGEIFDSLRAHEDVEESILAREEYLYLPLLTTRHKVKDLSLHKIMAKDAKFFIEVLCGLYKKKSAPKEEVVPSQQQKNRGEFAWHLLRSWKHPPGIDHNGQIIEGALKDWVAEARKLAADQDRTEMADLHIGHVLFHYPEDPTDSLWPHRELRRFIEDIQNEQIEHGIEIEQFNSRGVVSKELYEGGKQERLIAIKWRGWAGKMDIGWIRTRAMLERIASGWDAHAKREDERTEKDRLRFR
jgi:hypothetical protein